jgi:hypothetical protein
VGLISMFWSTCLPVLACCLKEGNKIKNKKTTPVGEAGILPHGILLTFHYTPQ